MRGSCSRESVKDQARPAVEEERQGKGGGKKLKITYFIEVFIVVYAQSVPGVLQIRRSLDPF